MPSRFLVPLKVKLNEKRGVITLKLLGVCFAATETGEPPLDEGRLISCFASFLISSF